MYVFVVCHLEIVGLPCESLLLRLPHHDLHPCRLDGPSSHPPGEEPHHNSWVRKSPARPKSNWMDGMLPITIGRVC